MIYLLKSPCWNPNYVKYKVGYTSDINRRIKQYEPETLLIATRIGEVIDEQVLHYRLKLIPSIVKIFRNEWYVMKKNDSSIIDVFHNAKISIEKTVWKILEPSKSSDTVYDYLSSKYFRTCTKTSFNFRSEDPDYYIYSYADLGNGRFPEEVKKFFKEMSRIGNISDRLKFLCEYQCTDDGRKIILDHMSSDNKIKYFYLTLGPERCKANLYQFPKILEEIKLKIFNKQKISKEIYMKFREGQRRTLVDIKNELWSIYHRIGYYKNPKATDILEFFETKKCMTTDKITGKRSKAYHLIKKLL
jgi:hypothetical protein